MEDRCPFCGAAEISMPEGRFYYACGTYGISEEGRSGQCWKEELATLRRLLEKVLPVMRSIVWLHSKLSINCPFCGSYFPGADEWHEDTCSIRQAQALLPEIERVVGKEGGG